MSTEVPCNGCTECCRSGQGLFLHPELGDDVTAYETRTAVDTAGNRIFLLATTSRGACVYLGPTGCTIYQRRPLLCRTFDCRRHYLMLRATTATIWSALGSPRAQSSTRARPGSGP